MVVRGVSVLLAAAIAAQAVILCLATGGHVFTRLRSAELEAANQSTDLETLFAGTGIDEVHGALGRVENRFALGWLPTGAGAEAVSVLTLGGPALAVALVALLPSGPRRRAAVIQEDSAR